MTKIKTARTTEGEKFYYLGHTQAVVNDAGDSIEDILAEQDEKIELLNDNTGVSDYPEFETSKTYKTGTIVKYEGALYKFTADHAAGIWDSGEVKAWNTNAETQEKLTELGSDVVSDKTNIEYIKNILNAGGIEVLDTSEWTEGRYGVSVNGTIEEIPTANPIYSQPIKMNAGDTLIAKIGGYNLGGVSLTDEFGTQPYKVVKGLYTTEQIEYTYIADSDVYIVICSNRYYLGECKIVRTSTRLSELENKVQSTMPVNLVFTPSADFIWSTSNLSAYTGYVINIIYDFKIESSFTLPDDVTLSFNGGHIYFKDKSYCPNLWTAGTYASIMGKGIKIANPNNDDAILVGLKFPNNITNDTVYFRWFGNLRDVQVDENGLYDSDSKIIAQENFSHIINACLAVKNKTIVLDRDVIIDKPDGYRRMANGHRIIGINNPIITGLYGYSDGSVDVQKTLVINSIKELCGMEFYGVNLSMSPSGYYPTYGDETLQPFNIHGNKFNGSPIGFGCYININIESADKDIFLKTKNMLKGSRICKNTFINGGGGDWRYGQYINGSSARGTGYSAIAFGYADGWTISENKIYGNYCFGINALSAENCIIEKNSINGEKIESEGYSRGLVDGVDPDYVRCKEYDMIGAIRNYYTVSYQRPFAQFKNNIIRNNDIKNIMDEGICFENYINHCVYVGTVSATIIEELFNLGSKTKYRITINGTLPDGTASARNNTINGKAEGCDITVINGNAKGVITELKYDNEGYYVECDKFANVSPTDLVAINVVNKNNHICGNILEEVRRPAIYLDGDSSFNKIYDNLIKNCIASIRIGDYCSDGNIISLCNYNEVYGNKVYDSRTNTVEPINANDASLFEYSTLPIVYMGGTMGREENQRILRNYALPLYGIIIGNPSKDQYTFDGDDISYTKKESINIECRSFGNIIRDNDCERIHVYNQIDAKVYDNIGSVVIQSCDGGYNNNINQEVSELYKFEFVEKVYNGSDFKLDYTFVKEEDMSLRVVLNNSTNN